jgi:hypothetical protein
MDPKKDTWDDERLKISKAFLEQIILTSQDFNQS